MPERRAAPLLGAVLLGVALLTGGLTGCAWPGSMGSAPPPPDTGSTLPKYYDPAPLIADVGARTRSDGGAALAVAGTLTDRAGPVPVTGEGAVRFVPEGGAPAVRLDLRAGPEGAPPGTTGVVRIGERTWLHPQGAADWVEPGIGPIAPEQVADATLAANVAAGADPLAAIARYPEAVLVADARDTDVDGVPVVHYTLVVDLVRAIAVETEPDRLAALTAQQQAGVTRISTEIWLDADRRPLRARLRQQLPDAGTLDLLLRYRDWGSPVTIEPPVRG
ncbi:hypothetical protein GCM10009613_62070 [Pseudonocardia kongjuensis]|uniref:Lipoprotein n=1 Tax=Pseudonocardia kongjuensis TaxID=102227 RepID=A0ABP4IYW3_9PSEU